MKPLVLVYGLGNFGYALLKHLDRYRTNDYRIAAFDRDPAVMRRLRRYRQHTRINPTHYISPAIILPQTAAELFPQADIIILAVTSQSIPEIIDQFNGYAHSKKPILLINSAKALATESGERLEVVIARSFRHAYRYAYLAGGTIAEDLYNSYPLGATIASTSRVAAREAKHLLAAPTFRLYPTSDVAGAEYCAAFKNVVSIFAGIVAGLGWPYGSETYFISRFSREVERFVIKELKGRPTTFSMDSQCWGNDLWMSCTGKTRNRAFGVLLGKGASVRQALLRMPKGKRTVEGLTTLSVLPRLCADCTKYPFLSTMIDIVVNGKKPAVAIERLMTDPSI